MALTRENTLGINLWSPPGFAAAADYDRYVHDYDLEHCHADFERVVGQARSFVPDESGEREVRDKIISLIREKRPASVLRLGDGEGNILLSSLDDYHSLQTYCLGRISRICFGLENVVLDNVQLFRNILFEAIDNADVIGGPTLDTIERSFTTPLEDLDVRGMCGMRGTYNALAQRKLSGIDIWTSTWFSRWLLPAYQAILGEIESLGVITCYPELPELLRRRTRSSTVQSYILPMQSSIARKTATGKSNGHFPNVFYETLDRLESMPENTVFIVAGGILAKAYCTKIKQLGGIAIDVGSVADVWMNIQSRPGLSENFVKRWRLEQ